MLKEKVRAFENNFITRQAELAHLKRDLGELQEEITSNRLEIGELETMRVLYQTASDEARQVFVDQFQSIVTKALQFTFGPEFQFVIESKESHGKPEIEFWIESEQDGVTVRTGLEDSTGGGLVDIVSLALRMAIIELYNDPVLNGPLQLDEPGKHVSENYAIKLAQFLKECGKTFDRQIIMVTHQTYLSAIADRNLQVELRNGKSIVTIT